MAQRVRIPHRGQSPSSVTQLPILTALHARSPTLFGVIILHNREIVNEMQKRVITMKKGVIVSDEEKGGYIDED